MRTDTLLLQDMLDAIGEVVETTPSSQTEFDADKFLQSHLLRHIQIIGEAASRIGDGVKAANPQIPWRQIAGMRHVLVHDYFEVNWQRVYETARDHVPPLQIQVREILRSLEAE